MSSPDEIANFSEYLERIQRTLVHVMDNQLESLHFKLHDKSQEVSKYEKERYDMAANLTAAKLDLSKMNEIISHLYVHL